MTLIREGYDDFNRRRRDKEINNKKFVRHYPKSGFISSSEIKVKILRFMLNTFNRFINFISEYGILLHTLGGGHNPSRKRGANSRRFGFTSNRGRSGWLLLHPHRPIGRGNRLETTITNPPKGILHQ